MTDRYTPNPFNRDNESQAEYEIRTQREELAVAREKRNEAIKAAGVLAVFVVICVALIACVMWAWQHFKVYSRTQDGRAILAKAQLTRQVATLDAQAEVARARGVAEANRIIGDSLKNNEGYLRYLYVNNLRETSNQVIYLPTEAGLPVLESRRLDHVPAPQQKSDE